MTQLPAFKIPVITDDNFEFDLLDPSLFEKPCDTSSVINFGRLFMPILYAIIFATGLLGNLLVIVTLVLYVKPKTMVDIYLMNLAIADLIFLCTLPFWAADAYTEWIFGTFMCKIMNGLYTINFYSCMLTLACISVNRYNFIVQSTKMYKSRTKIIYSKLACTGLWVLAIILALPEFILSEAYTGIPDKIICTMVYPPNSDIIKVGVHVTQLVVGFLIPFVTMIICYTIIAKTLLHAKGFQKNKSLKIIVAVVIVFMICELPFNIVLLMRTLEIMNEKSMSCELRVNVDYAIIITEGIAYVHCCLNPILYVFLGVKFRNNFMKILKDMGCISQNQLAKYLKTECETSQQKSGISETTSLHPL
ncbi:C-C chemokine receptor type 7-like [Mobula hypostoma]|uniref:C-C chemokine receptor type 7-like n=1 Tax=Mobula hypostoma TaxID=723540 RepID=UPI002FC3B1B0